ncbi:hypothetical protein SAMN02927924_01678 [Sphingobium faniae]|nr:hypothetical protein SAMN02927924_01678 [Sphingobium faniae]
MTARVHTGRGGHAHAEWESLPLLQSTRPRRHPIAVFAIAFLVGLLIGIAL